MTEDGRANRTRLRECIITIVRLAYAHTFDAAGYDPTWDNVDIGLLTIVEQGIGILCACVPTYRPLYIYLFPGSKSTMGVSGKTSGERYGSSANTSRGLGGRRPYSEGGGIGLGSGKGWKGSKLGSETEIGEEPVVGEDEVYGDAVRLQGGVGKGMAV